MLYKDFNNKMGIIILIFRIFINTNLFKTSLLLNKIQKTILIIVFHFK